MSNFIFLLKRSSFILWYVYRDIYRRKAYSFSELVEEIDEVRLLLIDGSYYVRTCKIYCTPCLRIVRDVN
jgi:hypothetical protein